MTEPQTPTLACLTPKMRTIAHLLSEGRTTKQIAGVVGCSVVQVRKQIHLMGYRIGLENRDQDTRVRIVRWYLSATGKLVA